MSTTGYSWGNKKDILCFSTALISHYRIHTNKGKQNKAQQCPVIRVHKEKMVDSKKEKYLGDFIDTSGKIRSTIEDIPLGKHRMDIGLHLREAMLLNVILFNSEAWHSLSLSEIKTLESVDEQLLRGLVKAQSKTPLEFLYLEAGANPIRFIISTRRMTYLQTILKRSDEELTKRI